MNVSINMLSRLQYHRAKTEAWKYEGVRDLSNQQVAIVSLEWGYSLRMSVQTMLSRQQANIKCTTMSDRASTEMSFDDLLFTTLKLSHSSWKLGWAASRTEGRCLTCTISCVESTSLWAWQSRGSLTLEITHQESETTTVSTIQSLCIEAGYIRFIRTACKAFEKWEDQNSDTYYNLIIPKTERYTKGTLVHFGPLQVQHHLHWWRACFLPLSLHHWVSYKVVRSMYLVICRANRYKGKAVLCRDSIRHLVHQ